MNYKVFSATVTPLLADGSLDRVGLARVFERNLRHGLSGVFILGSMGEWGSFSEAFKEELLAESSRLLAARGELLVGINASSVALSLEYMRCYAKYDFDSYVFMLPGATNAIDPCKAILQVLEAAPRPVYYYHCPPVNHKNLSIEQFAAIMAHPNLKGIKNSASDMRLRRELLLLKRQGGFKTLLCEGQEWSLDEALMVGCDGMVCGLGALGSKFMVEIARAAEAGNADEAMRLQNRFIELFHGVYGRDLSTVWCGQKYALQQLGLIESDFTLAQDMERLTEERKQEIEDCLQEFKDELD